MMKRILFPIIFCVSLGLAKAPDGMNLNKNSASSDQSSFTYSNISNWSFYIPYSYAFAAGETYHHGATYPKATAKAVYQDGFIWGGIVDKGTYDEIKTGGRIYSMGLVPGRVETWGDYDEATIADPTDPAVRVYRIRKNYEYLTHSQLKEDAADFYQIDPSSVTEAMTLELKDQYQLDWEEWPGEQGAPYQDLNLDGVYTPGIDEPGIANADQVTWYVMNDYNESVTQTFMESEPIGLEYQLTSWAYDCENDRLGQLVFFSHKLINTSNDTVKDMYMGQWCDPDIGKSTDDLIGCDTVLDMGFAYNGRNTDEDYDPFNLAPPAIGYDMLQGAMVKSPGDTALMDLELRSGYKDLGMSSFVPAITASQGSGIVYPENYSNLKYYNLLRGYRGDENIDDPTSWYVENDTLNTATKFPLSGDPLGYDLTDVDGTQYWLWLGDRKFLMSTGPFDFAPGDTQQVIMALIGGLGADNIGSLADMKLTSRIIQESYNEKFQHIPGPPKIPVLRGVPFENSLVLEWGSFPGRVSWTEEHNELGYLFEGYNVYQLPYTYKIVDGQLKWVTPEECERLATFDLVNGIKLIKDERPLEDYPGITEDVVVAYGSDSGIQRYLKVDWDHVNDCPLYEGQCYYFAITAYDQNLNDDRLGAKMYESDMFIIAVVLQEELPGSGLQSYFGQNDFAVEQTAGSGSGIFRIKVIDPYEITGEDYSISFSYDRDSTDLEFNIISEYGEELSTANPVASDTLLKTSSPIVDGLEITVVHSGSYSSLTIDDVFSFSTAGYEMVHNDSLMDLAIDKINVFPNPYYGFDVISDPDFNEYVTFTHLPAKATIRIFNLAGILVNTLEHENSNSQFETWNLANRQNIRVGSGMYIAHISMPDIGKEKILKFMIVRGGLY